MDKNLEFLNINVNINILKIYIFIPTWVLKILEFLYRLKKNLAF